MQSVEKLEYHYSKADDNRDSNCVVLKLQLHTSLVFEAPTLQIYCSKFGEMGRFGCWVELGSQRVADEATR